MQVSQRAPGLERRCLVGAATGNDGIGRPASLDRQHLRLVKFRIIKTQQTNPPGTSAHPLPGLFEYPVRFVTGHHRERDEGQPTALFHGIAETTDVAHPGHGPLYQGIAGTVQLRQRTVLRKRGAARNLFLLPLQVLFKPHQRTSDRPRMLSPVTGERYFLSHRDQPIARSGGIEPGTDYLPPPFKIELLGGFLPFQFGFQHRQDGRIRAMQKAQSDPLVYRQGAGFAAIRLLQETRKFIGNRGFAQQRQLPVQDDSGRTRKLARESGIPADTSPGIDR